MRSTLIKELKILLRDPVGFLLLLIMPGVLIVVMAVTQDSSYKDLQDAEFEVCVVNLDQGAVGKALIKAIDESDKFKVKLVADTNTLKALVDAGEAKIGVVIPEKANSAIVNVANKFANLVSDSKILSQNDALDSVSVSVLFDPILKPALKNGFRFALTQYITQVKMDMLMGRLNKMASLGADGEKNLTKEMTEVLALKEQAGNNFDKKLMPLNSVQHNVPSWTIFAMFLIVVPIAGNMLREREEGSITRIKLIPGALVKSTIGILFFYVLVCTLQFYLLIMIGVYIMPSFGLPQLSIGVHPWQSLPLVLATAFAATAYGYFIGSVFKTANQAMPVGAISVVILASLGGIWVPLELLPKLMTKIALYTPMYWSFNGINNLFIRGLGLASTLPFIGLLMGFGTLLTALSIFLSGRRSES